MNIELNIEPGTRLLIYLIGVLTVLLLDQYIGLLMVSSLLLGIVVIKKNITNLYQKLYFFLPFLLTTVLLGFFHQGGWYFTGKLVLRLMIIFLWNSIIFAGFNESQLVVGMDQLHMPRLITIVIFFIFRYRSLLQEKIKQLLISRRIRGARVGYDWFNIKEYLILAQVIGAGLIHSLEQGDRVYQAMKLRGLQIETLISNHNRLRQDWQVVAITIVIATGFLLLDRGAIF
ncbi:ABC-type cobalt transport system, permease component CbiQ [Halobacteroides halobius DSM 5150]|uniref:ABC-type cobalt transport system, permease component CbiQ n=1 Tax=Halobacteroides halobius (strain ATCC 35273 / DSM 5150 / MD-1) TaxID=748449 RepID=L0KAX3_HALHC|nr:energy-coupling factor transporter transmembrane component T [Halobacteroides halobius]AGB41690.1 ABC-type cobalt transport system, permease component CbiQ [Halobacteroides halobius DSM 5150]